MKNTDTTFLTTRDVARRIDLVPNRVRQLADEQKIPAIRTASGQRLFKLADVERFIEQRKAASIASEVRS